MTNLTVTEEFVTQSYQLFLGRSPNAGAVTLFPTQASVIGTLIRSKEFLNSSQAIKTRLGWPLFQHFIVPDAGLLYCPIGKNACTFLKRLMVRIAQHPQEAVITHSIHAITDRVKTGMQLSDYTREEAGRLISAPDLFSFAVLRNPERRLLSAYIEKFVKNRLDPNNIKHHTHRPVADVQARHGMNAPDFERGISFRDFIESITAFPPETLDPHWRPQVLYLKGVEWRELYDFDRLDLLVSDLEARTGMTLDAAPQNASGSGQGAEHPRADTLLPAQLDALPMISAASFLTPALTDTIRHYFKSDFDLMQAIPR